MRRRSPRTVIAVMLAVSSCSSPQTVVCGDGRTCPGSKVCAPDGEGFQCVDPDQVTACRGLSEGAVCELGSAGEGRCRNNLCVVAGCGDGVLDLGEVCDDGNGASGDGCRGDCQKVEVCGDAVVDEGEPCDDGNGNAADGCDHCVATEWLAEPVVGGDRIATSVDLYFPNDVAVDALGNLYIADTSHHRIRRLDAATGVITTVAGTGTRGFSGDGGPATSAELANPGGVAVDGLGNLFVADRSNHRVRMVDRATGVITTVAGTETDVTGGFSGDNGPATSAELRSPADVVVDGLGSLYVVDRGNVRIRRVDGDTGVITTVAGGGTPPDGVGDDGPAIEADLYLPNDVVVDGHGNLFIAENSHRIRRVDGDTGVITTVAGTGTLGFAGDGGLATAAELRSPSDIALDNLGNLFVADRLNDRIRRVDGATGIITTAVGGGSPPDGYGDGGPANGAVLADPSGVAVDSSGNLFVADTQHHRIRRVDGASNDITTIAGTGGRGDSGDGGAATSVRLIGANAAVVDGLGNLYISAADDHRIRRVDVASGVISTVAGTGTAGFSGDGGPATNAEIYTPRDIALDAAANLYIVDHINNRIRRVDSESGGITTVVGLGTRGFSGDDDLATGAELDRPTGVAVDGAGNLFIADGDNQRVRRVDATTGIITTVAGNGTPGSAGDGDLATSAELKTPSSLAFDGDGSLLIGSDTRVRRVDVTTGVITRVAGGGSPLDLIGDGGLAVDARLTGPSGITVDADGNLFIADPVRYRIRRVDAVSKIITTVAGTGTYGFSGDGGPAIAAELYQLGHLSLDNQGNLLVADRYNHRIRRVDAASQVITTVVGEVAPPNMGPLAQARLSDPRGLAVTPELTVFAGGTSGTLQALREESGWLDVVAGRYPHSPATGNLARFREEGFGTVTGVAYDEAEDVIYLSESDANQVHVVTVVDPSDENTWTIATLAGGPPGFADGSVAAARFRYPTGLEFDDGERILYVADSGNHVIRAVDLSAGIASATVSTVAGIPQTLGYFGDGGPATGALLQGPQAVARCTNGDFFISDTGNNRIRRIAAGTRIMTTVLGDGVAASSGQGGPAVGFPVDSPLGLACDSIGNLFVASASAVRFLPADDGGIVDGSGAVQTIFGAPPRDTFPASVSSCLTDVTVIDEVTVWLTDSCTGMVIELWRQARP